MIGSWIQINHPTSAEILANAGFDWIGVDLEHSDIDIVSFTQILGGIYGRCSNTLSRIKFNNIIDIRRVLDVGAIGILVPIINTKADAQNAVRAAKYPPSGIRGYSFSRMNNWGVEFD